MKEKSLNKEIEDTKKNQVEILELKNTVSEIKHTINGLNSRKEGTGEKSVNQKIE